MRSHWLKVGPNPMTGMFIRIGKFGHGDAQGGHVTMKVQVGVMCINCRAWLSATGQCWAANSVMGGAQESGEGF